MEEANFLLEIVHDVLHESWRRAEAVLAVEFRLLEVFEEPFALTRLHLLGESQGLRQILRAALGKFGGSLHPFFLKVVQQDHAIVEELLSGNSSSIPK